MLRTHTCGELRVENIGEKVRLCGWIDTIREHANVTFIVLRDRYGLTQITVSDDLLDKQILSKESTAAIDGVVIARPPGMVNEQMATGEIEVTAAKIEVLGVCKLLPFEVRDNVTVSDDLRMEYRYLDLRRPVMLDRVLTRHKIVAQVRRSLEELDFIEIEPPMFVKSTPEGSRDFIVPSRRYPGRFYALPQSPQLYKQILMIAGVDRYYSIPRCFRDEDARRGRQLVHTQVDLEMSFAEEEDVYATVEKFLTESFKNVLGIDVPAKFPRFTYDEVIDRWGIDKPDLRFGMELINLTGASKTLEYEMFDRVILEEGIVKGLIAPGCAGYSRSKLAELEEYVQRYQAKGLLWIKMEEDGVKSSFGQKMPVEKVRSLAEKANAQVGDLVLIVAGKPGVVARALGELRNYLGGNLGLIDREKICPLWVCEFPMFEWDDEGEKWSPMHHMFTMPKEDHLEFLTSRPGDVRARLYDIVLNGVELGSGSVRITNPSLQQRIMEFVGYRAEAAQENFGFLLRAYEYGAPPHAGIALGIDNLVMTMMGLTNLIDVIAFPNNSAGIFPLDDSPSIVTSEQLEECNIKIIDL